MHVRGMKGLGDNIYQRAFVRAVADRESVHLETPWPELYEDLPVSFVQARTPLRTQAKNLARQPRTRWSRAPQGAQTVAVRYTFPPGIVPSMARVFGLDPAALTFDLPDFGPAPVSADRPLAVVRPVTQRSEWRSGARNPAPECVATAAEALMRTHHVVSVADVNRYHEWLVGSPPPAHVRFHAGELSVVQLLALVQSAEVAVGGVGWIVPASIAAGVRLACVLGGRGAHNAPEVITDPSMDLSRIGWFKPDNYCMCSQPEHDCDKRITNFGEQFEQWMQCSSTGRAAA